MKKRYVVLIIIGALLVNLVVLPFLSPISALWIGTIFESIDGNNAEIEIDSFRLCEDIDGKDVIIIKYLLKNNGKEPTSLLYEGDFYVYQEGVSLVECFDELPNECHYDLDDQYKDIKGGVEYCAEIAYWLEYPDKDVEVEVNDYGLFGNKKEKVFVIK